MIPKFIHRVWPDGDGLSPDPVPEEYERYWEESQRLHPDWEHFTWPSLPVMRNQRLWDEAEERSPAWSSYRARTSKDHLRFRADVLRLEVLHCFGGIYIDTDLEPLRSFEQLRHSDCWLVRSRNKPSMVTNAVMGAVPRHPFIRHLLDTLEASSDRYRGQRIVDQVGPGHLTRELEHAGQGAVVLDEHTFGPRNKAEADTHRSYGWHHWRNRNEP